MKHIILFLLTVMASLAILPSCSDSEPERMTPCEIHFSLGPDIELHGVVSFDSILSAPSIIIEAADAKKAWPEISDSISGMRSSSLKMRATLSLYNASLKMRATLSLYNTVTMSSLK